VNKAEVHPKRSEHPQIVTYLRHHPLSHLGILFCSWFTVVVVLDDLQDLFWQVWPHWTQAHRYGYALSMTAIFFFLHRYKMRSIASADSISSSSRQIEQTSDRQSGRD
jgi:hypothetical protein